jgi:hypothetical protein
LCTSDARGSRIPNSWEDKVDVPPEGLTSDVGPWDFTSKGVATYLLYTSRSGRWYKKTRSIKDGGSYSLVSSIEEQLLVSEAQEGEILPGLI